MTDIAQETQKLEELTERMLALGETQLDLLAELAVERAAAVERISRRRDLDGAQAEQIRRAMERGEIVTGKVRAWRESWRAALAECAQKMRLAGELGHTVESAGSSFEITG